MKKQSFDLPKVLVLHPILFAVWLILYWDLHNINQFLLEMLVTTGSIFALGAGIFFLLLWAVFRDAIKAGVIASACMLWFFSFHFFADGLGSIFPALHATELATAPLVTIYLTAWIGSLWFLCRIKHYAPEVNTILNVVSGGLLVWNALGIASYELQIQPASAQTIAAIEAADATEKLRSPSDPPDIYYIILDSMGRSDTFKNNYAYDDSDFISYLRKKGFYVATESNSNYAWTLFSLSSSLNMEYLDWLPLTHHMSDLQILERMIQDNRVARQLKSAGYKFVYSGPNFLPMHAANEVFDPGWPSVFDIVILECSALHILPEPWEPLAPISRNHALIFFKNLQQICTIPGPKFVFVHVFLPHNPYLFQKNGLPLKANHFSVLNDWENRQQYIDQVQFLESQLKKVVDVLLQDGHKQPIVILQGDHGPMCAMGAGEDKIPYLKERMSIFNAYFLPRGGEKKLYNSISPVNSFRVIFDYYFGTNYPLLPDRSNYSPAALPFLYGDVTDKVNGASSNPPPPMLVAPAHPLAGD